MPRRPARPGELGVLPRCDGHPRLAVELLELLEHDGAGRHVDAEREGLGGEDDLHQLALEELLDDLLEGRDHAGVVGGDAPFEPFEPRVVPEHAQVLVAQARAALLDQVPDLVALPLLGEAHIRAQHLLHGLVAADPAEDEEDRGQQIAIAEQPHDIGPVHAIAQHLALALVATRMRTPVGAGAAAAGDGEPCQLGIHPRRRVGCLGAVEQLGELALHEHVLLERHGTPFGHDDVGVPPYRLQPVAELLRVGDGRRERHHAAPHAGRWMMTSSQTAPRKRSAR